ncbi:MAG: hypothetical protein IJ856_05140 [Candidatus Methanomethylophilaceae archaeon]|nr:hypothetical protein [Candidatus Methanomethylophilaceae archaeon]
MGVSVKDLIGLRRSVRTFDGRPVDGKVLESLEKHLSAQTNPFGVRIDYGMFEADGYGLSSQVLEGEHIYVAAKMEKGLRQGELAMGYVFEEFCLYALSLGLGTVILASTFDRPRLEEVFSVGTDEVMPVCSPIGYPSETMSETERRMRRNMGSDSRLPFDQLFSEGSFGKPVSGKCGYRDSLEMVRLAPSARNIQPWRLIVDGDAVHFYELRTIPIRPTGDVQKLDVGIAAAHFDLCQKEKGNPGKFVDVDPGMTVPENMEYCISYEMD